MSITFKELKKEKLKHFFTKINGTTKIVHVVASIRLYVDDEQLKETAEEFLAKNSKNCYRKLEEIEDNAS